MSGVRIYRAASLIDAQLIVDELAAGGMQARIAGHYLGAAVGELPAEGLVDVWLLEARHRRRARALIEEYEAERRRAALVPDHPCAGCGELLGAAFGHCWQCGRQVD